LAERVKFRLRAPWIDWQFCVAKFNQGELDGAKTKELGIDQVRFAKLLIPDNVVDDDWISDLFPPSVPRPGAHKKEV
jgi:hypothetical protein